MVVMFMCWVGLGVQLVVVGWYDVEGLMWRVWYGWCV